MNDPERDDLWELLGKAKPPKVSPFFARNVLREARNLDSGQAPAWRRAWLQWRWPALGATAALAALLALGPLGTPPAADAPAAPAPTASAEALDPADFDVIVNLDELLALDSTSTWLE
jgi:hypothetical protein